MSQINIIDNFLSEEAYNKLWEFMSSSAVYWQLTNDVIDIEKNELTCDEKYNWQFCHLFYHTPADVSNIGECLDDLLDKINPTILIRIKANLTTVSPELIKHGYHIDVNPGKMADITTTGIYYLNTCDGVTEFEDGTVIKSIANRYVSFPAHMRHTGSTTTDAPYRMVINFNYIDCPKEEDE